VKKELKQERKKLRTDIDSLENRIKWMNIAGMPALVPPRACCSPCRGGNVKLLANFFPV
jgi:hypothetical protein